MKFIVSEHTHVTATERKAIAQMIAAGMTNARNRPNTKAYEVTAGSSDGKSKTYSIRIATREVRHIGSEMQWYFNSCQVVAPVAA